MTPELIIAFASPSDVKDEWSIAEQAVRSVNKLLRVAAHPTRFHLARWNLDVPRGYQPGGAQERIDAHLIDKCDVLVAVFHERYGESGGSSESGTAHELWRAYHSREQNERPEVLAYFKDGPYYPANSREADQLQKVLALRENLESKKLLSGRFREVFQFYDYLQGDLYSFAMNRNTPKSSVPSLTVESCLPTLARAECIAERISDIVLRTGVGPARTIDLQIFLNTQVTNRILRDRSADVFLVTEDGTRPRELVMGQCVGSNSVLFSGVPVGGHERQWRISNLRVSSNALQSPSSVICVVSSDLTASKAWVVAGRTAPGLEFDVLDADSEAPLPPYGVVLSQSKNYFGARVATLRFGERYPGAFKMATVELCRSLPASIVFQDCVVPLSESGTTVSGADGTVIGLANSGTRLCASFHNVPVGLRLFVSRGSSRSTAGLNAHLIDENRDISPSDSRSVVEHNGISCVELSTPQGFSTVVWEITDRGNVDRGWLEFAVFASFEGAPHLNSPALGTACVNGSFSPISTVTSASASPVPRFADTSRARNVLQVMNELYR